MKVMVWACFTGNRLGPMIICDEGGIGANEYEDTLYDGSFSVIDDLLAIPDDVEEVQVANENAYVFMQDNACCHKVNDVLEFLQENNVPLMEWPAQSPDLNPIENILVRLQRMILPTIFRDVQLPIKGLGSVISV